MDTQSQPPNKKKRKSTPILSSGVSQWRMDVKKIFRDVFDDEKFSIHSKILNEGDTENFTKLIYISKHFLSKIKVRMMSQTIEIIPISINLTEESYVPNEDGELVVYYSRVAIGFISENTEEQYDPETDRYVKTPFYGSCLLDVLFPMYEETVATKETPKKKEREIIL
jgi:hypothetical protein